jgi:hypothetical protein
MDIAITFQEGKWFTDPNPAFVIPGTQIRWIVRFPRTETAQLRWIIDFRGNAPFPTEEGRLIVVTTNTGLGRALVQISEVVALSLKQLGISEEILVDHRGETPPVTAEKPGEYKYDLHLIDAETGKPVGDDDPLLYVITRWSF